MYLVHDTKYTFTDHVLVIYAVATHQTLKLKVFALYFEHIQKPGCTVTNIIFVVTASYFMLVHFI